MGAMDYLPLLSVKELSHYTPQAREIELVLIVKKSKCSDVAVDARWGGTSGGLTSARLANHVSYTAVHIVIEINFTNSGL